MIYLIGAEGRIGKRYQAILKQITAEFRCKEVNDEYNFDGISRIILATPTDTHIHELKKIIPTGLPILCEKPISKHVTELKYLQTYFDVSNIYMVNNYDLIRWPKQTNTIYYNFYNHGNDGHPWDLCQLHAIAYWKDAKFEFQNTSHSWTLIINGEKIPYLEIEESYKRMLIAFISLHRDLLWNFERSLRVSEICGELNDKGY